MSNYPTPPGPRIPYDRDGSLGFMRSGTTAVDTLGSSLSQAQLKALADESTSSSVNTTGSSASGVWWLIFPSKRDISYLHLSVAPRLDTYTNLGVVEWSPDTTTGTDGTWSTVSGVTNKTVNRNVMRNSWDAVNLTGVKALRWRASGSNADTGVNAVTLHLYGKPTLAEDRLEFWHPTLNASLFAYPDHLDWGDRPRGTVATKEVRVKNISSGLTASTVTVGVEALTDSSSPTMVSQYALSIDGGTTWASTVTIPALSPGGVSDVIQVRQTLDEATSLGLWDQRLYASAAGWA